MESETAAQPNAKPLAHEPPPARGIGSDPAPREPVPQFPYQIVDAYLWTCRVERRDATPEDPAEPTFNTTFAVSQPDVAGGFNAQLTVELTYRFREEAACELTVTTNGRFERVGEIADASAGVFRQADCAVLLWPYARGFTGELGRMLGVGLPPLPTLDVRALLPSQG